MDEKQRLAAADAAACAPPPYVEYIELPIEIVEAAYDAAEEDVVVPAWIQRLPWALPLTHALIAIPAALFGTTTLSEATMLCSAVSFVLLATSTALAARATRHDERAQHIAIRRLASAGIAAIAWPLLALLMLAHMPAGCHSSLQYASTNANASPARAFTIHSQEHTKPAPATPDAVGAVVSSKGAKVLVATSDEDTLDSDATLKATLPFLQEAVMNGGLPAGGLHVVVSTKGNKPLIDTEPEAASYDVSTEEQL